MIEQISLPAYLGREFTALHGDGHLRLRADELGEAFGLVPPEAAVLEIYTEHWPQFPDPLAAFLPVETSEGPRRMLALTPLGAYVLATYVPQTPQVQQFRRWLMEAIVCLQLDLRRAIERLRAEDIARLKDEDRRLRETIDALCAEVEALKEMLKRGGPVGGAVLDADYRRLQEEQAQLLRSLAGQVAGFLERLPDELALAVEDARLFAIADDLQAGLKPLAEAVTGLRHRLDKALRPPARRDAERAARSAGRREGVAALAVPEHHFMAFEHEDGGTLRALIYRDRPTPWFPAEDLGRLAGQPAFQGDGLAGQVERLVPEPHRDYASADRSLPIVDPVGLDALLWAWTRPLDDDGEAADGLWAWIAGTVMPSLHAVMLREAQLDPAAETHPGFPRAPAEVAADGPFKVYAGELDGRPAKLVNGRDLHRFLALGWRQFGEWWRDKVRWAAWQDGRDFFPVFVHLGRYDPYLSLDAALTCLLTENGPKKAEAEEYLKRVALGLQGAEGATIEGEARRVSEGAVETTSPMPMTYQFEKSNVRVVMKEGETFWVARDVAEALDYPASSIKTINKLIAPVPNEWKGRNPIPTLGGEQDLVVLSEQGLYFFLGRSDKPKALPFQKKVAEILTTLRRTGRYEMPGAAGARTSRAGLAETPPNSPLVFEYRDEKDRPIPVRVALRQGLGWAAAPGLALALGNSLAELEKASALIPRGWVGSMPSPSGESLDLALSEQALGYLFGQRAHHGPAMAFREWWFREVEPVLRGGGVPQPEPVAKSTTEPPEPAPKPSGEEPPPRQSEPAGSTSEAPAEEPVRARFEALTLWFWRQQGRHTHAAFPSCVAILLLLWEEAREGEWMPAGTRGYFARRLGTATGKSAEAALQRLRNWGLVELRPEGVGWPEEIRLHLENLAKGLREAGLEDDAREGGS